MSESNALRDTMFDCLDFMELVKFTYFSISVSFNCVNNAIGLYTRGRGIIIT